MGRDAEDDNWQELARRQERLLPASCRRRRRLESRGVHVPGRHLSTRSWGHAYFGRRGSGELRTEQGLGLCFAQYQTRLGVHFWFVMILRPTPYLWFVAAAIAALPAVPAEAEPDSIIKENAPRQPAGIGTAGNERAAVSPTLDWLLGVWKQPAAVAPRLELAWTAAVPDGLHGILERIERSGTRKIAATYSIEIHGDAVTLTRQHQPEEKGPSTATTAPSGRHSQPARRRGETSPNPQQPWSEVFKGSIGGGQVLQVYWDPKSSDRKTRSKEDALLLQLTVRDRTLVWEEKRRSLGIGGRWSYVTFEKAPNAREGASQPALVP
jgi:hypothetical protein